MAIDFGYLTASLNRDELLNNVTSILDELADQCDAWFSLVTASMSESDARSALLAQIARVAEAARSQNFDPTEVLAECNRLVGDLVTAVPTIPGEARADWKSRIIKFATAVTLLSSLTMAPANLLHFEEEAREAIAFVFGDAVPDDPPAVQAPPQPRALLPGAPTRDGGADRMTGSESL
jgi:hypothetical protein